jgi:hypothetical protein
VRALGVEPGLHDLVNRHAGGAADDRRARITCYGHEFSRHPLLAGQFNDTSSAENV